MKNKGISTHRFKDNPEEKRFAEAWEEQNNAGRTLDYLLTPPSIMPGHGRPPEAAPWDRRVAATVIQWLGSPVGQAFLRDLGYEKKP